MIILVRICSFLFLIGGACLGWLYGHNVSFAEQWPLFEALRNTAAIIFAVVGAWFAIIYPERMKGVLSSSPSIQASTSKGLGKLFSPIVHSTVILCIILLIGVLAPLIKGMDFVVVHKLVFRKISYSLLCLLTLWQIWTVLVTLVPALILKEASDRQELDEENDEAYGSNKNL
ncbi:hypothetical protein HA399_09235 [Cobetia sp. UIB-001]|uniref:hypothetical protein n=1 Tax=Cobetia sp. UIB-001 TaxID=2717697 RepID=UPI00385171FD